MASQNRIKTFSGTDATANDNVLLVTIEDPDFSDYTIHATAGTVDVEVTVDKTNWSTAIPVMDMSGSALASDEVTVNKIGVVTGPVAGLRVRKKGVTNPTTVKVMARG